MYLQGCPPLVEDVLLSDQFLYEYSPAESIINFELPTGGGGDPLPDLEFTFPDSDGEDYFNFTAGSPLAFDLSSLEVDDLLLDSLNETLHTDSSDEDPQNGLLVLGVEHGEPSPLGQEHGDTSPQGTQPQRKMTFAEPAWCAELSAFVCPVAECGRLYAKASHVRAHLRRHSGERPYRCTWAGCAWRFARSDELARHRRSHSGDRPYACSECPKRFARSDHLAKHSRVHARRRLAAAAATTTTRNRKHCY